MPSTYLKRIERAKSARTFDRESIENAESQKFASFGWDYSSALQTLDDRLIQASMSRFGENQNMESVHWLLFAAISMHENVKNILEIGTYKGEATRVLRALFPEASIVTADVPESDPIMKESYGRDEQSEYEKFVSQRSSNLANSDANFIEANSFFLPEHVKPGFDLVWVDGGHLYPEIAWDICNAFHLCKDGGYILVDDVLVHPDSPVSSKVSRASYQVIEYLLQRKQLKHDFFLKRMELVPRNRKYVAVMQK
jgi:predicted O-methyltransferase YrrM